MLSTPDDGKCHRCNQHIHIHKTFEGFANHGKCSIGWFFGFKLHLIINDKDEILNFILQPVRLMTENLFIDGIQLFTKVKNNMKNLLMNFTDICLRKRALILNSK